MTDYKNAHIAWLKSTRDFICKYPADYSIPYIDVMSALYADTRIPDSMAEAMFVSDKAWYIKSKKISREIDKKVYALEPLPDGKFFVTIGFNHQTFTIEKAHKCIEKILAQEWIIKAKANFELYRENGEHPHVHFLLETKECKSRVLDKIFKPKYVKDLVLKKNFIDVKPAEERHTKYINLEKQADKMPYVQKDIIYRSHHKIPDYEKNW